MTQTEAPAVGQPADPSEPILVPLALAPSEAAGALADGKLPVVAQHARAFRAEVLLLHVLGESGGAAPPGEGVVPEAEAQARVYLESVAAQVRRAGLRARPLVRRGPVAATVSETAREHRARLIVVGRPPRRGLARLLKASAGIHADEIARLAPCPVLVVQPPVEAEAALALRPRRGPRRFDHDAVHVGPLAPYVLGTRTVEVSRVVGTVPPLDLGTDFRPVHPSVGQEARHRGTVAMMAERPEALPPVGLYKLGYGYYVFSGHAQVAAARALRQAWIDATVTEYVPLEDEAAQRVLAERLAFERGTGLTGIGAALPGTYPRLRDLIDTHAADAAALREDGSAPDLRTTAARWKASVFRPVQRRLRDLLLNQHFPGERSADIIIRLADHHAHKSALQRRTLSWEEALATFAASVTPTLRAA